VQYTPFSTTVQALYDTNHKNTISVKETQDHHDHLIINEFLANSRTSTPTSTTKTKQNTSSTNTSSYTTSQNPSCSEGAPKGVKLNPSYSEGAPKGVKLNPSYSEGAPEGVKLNPLYSRGAPKGVKLNPLYSRGAPKGVNSNPPSSGGAPKGVSINPPFSGGAPKGVNSNPPSSGGAPKGVSNVCLDSNDTFVFTGMSDRQRQDVPRSRRSIQSSARQRQSLPPSTSTSYDRRGQDSSRGRSSSSTLGKRSDYCRDDTHTLHESSSRYHHKRPRYDRDITSSSDSRHDPHERDGARPTENSSLWHTFTQYKYDLDRQNRRVELSPLFGHTSAKEHKAFLRDIRSTSLRRYISKPKIIFDICCGSNSLAKYYLAKYPDARVISIDIMAEAQSLESVPVHFRSRLHYEDFDIKNFTLDALAEMVQRNCGRSLGDVYAYHFSPDCSTYTTADKGRNNFRNDDGSANKTRAQLSDDNVTKVMSVLRELTHIHPDQMITCENPSTGIRLVLHSCYRY
jgi:hypothetical protein